MSVWSSFEGYVTVKKNSHLSMEKVVEASMGCTEFILKTDKSLTFNNRDLIRHKVYCSFCQGGQEAATLIQTLIQNIREFDAGAQIDIQGTITF